MLEILLQKIINVVLNERMLFIINKIVSIRNILSSVRSRSVKVKKNKV